MLSPETAASERTRMLWSARITRTGSGSRRDDDGSGVGCCPHEMHPETKRTSGRRAVSARREMFIGKISFRGEKEGPRGPRPEEAERRAPATRQYTCGRAQCQESSAPARRPIEHS